MSKLEEIISQVKEDIHQLEDLPKSEYLALQVISRINELNIKHDLEFEKYLSELENNIMYEQDLSRLSSSLVNFSNNISHVYRQLIDDIKNFQNIFK